MTEHDKGQASGDRASTGGGADAESRRLRESEEKYRALVENTPDVIARFDRSCRYLFVSRASSRYIPLRPEEFVGKTHLELGFPAEQARSWDEAILSVFETGASGERELELHSPDGQTSVFEWRLFPERGVDGSVLTVVTLSRDVTARRRAEQGLRESEERYRGLFEHMNEGFSLREVLRDAEGRAVDYRFLTVNPAYEKAFGLSKATVVGKRASELFSSVEPAWIERLGRVASTGEPVLFEGSVERADRWFEIKVFSPEKGLCAVLTTDITEQKRVEEDRAQLRRELVQAQRMEALGRLAGGVAHDFNNLLSVILGYTHLLETDLPAEGRQRGELGEIKRAAGRAAGLTRQLLAFSRKQLLQPRVIDLTRVVGGMNEMLRRLIGEHIELEVAVEGPVAPVIADPAQIEQVVMNLVVNARDAMPGGGVIRLALRDVTVGNEPHPRRAVPPGRFVTLSLNDTGMGMDEGTLAHLYEPFFTTKERGRGTGLGLASVYGIVKQSGGYIEAESEPGRGTTFALYFPAVERREVEETAEEHPSPPGRGETVLLVEDDPSVRRLTREMLERLGYTVVATGSGAEAIAVAGSPAAPVDLLLTDLVMPKMGGLELARELTARHPGLRVLYMSGYPGETLAAQGGLPSGAVILRKPFEPDELGRGVHEALQGRA